MDGRRGAELSVFTRAVIRALDILIAAPVAIVTSPVLVLVAFAVRVESRGPAIFRQGRLGLHKQLFTIYKFRTMRAEADPTVHRAYVEQLICGEESSHSSGRATFAAASMHSSSARQTLLSAYRVGFASSLNHIEAISAVIGPRPGAFKLMTRFLNGYMAVLQDHWTWAVWSPAGGGRCSATERCAASIATTRVFESTSYAR